MSSPSNSRARLVAYFVLFLVAVGVTALMVDENARLDTRGILVLAGICGVGVGIILRLLPRDDDRT